MGETGLNFTESGRNDTILKEQADVAQLVEQLIRNQQVVSSSLTVGSRGSKNGVLPEGNAEMWIKFGSKGRWSRCQ